MLEKVYAYVVEATKLEMSDQGNSLYISEQLQLSRNMVSQYLNQLFAEGRLLKINTRPVVFYDQTGWQSAAPDCSHIHCSLQSENFYPPLSVPDLLHTHT